MMSKVAHKSKTVRRESIILTFKIAMMIDTKLKEPISFAAAYATVFFATLFCLLFSGCGDARGKRISVAKGELFYAQSIPEPDAQRLAVFLRDSLGFFDEKHITMQIDMDTRGDYILRMVSETGLENDADFRKSALAVSRMVSEQVFADKAVHFVFVNENMESKGNVPFSSLGKRFRFGGFTVYAAEGVGEALTKAFGEKLVGQPFLPKEGIFQLRADTAYHMAFLAGPSEMTDSMFRVQLTSFAKECGPIFGDKPALYLEYADYVFEPQETVRLTTF